MLYRSIVFLFTMLTAASVSAQDLQRSIQRAVSHAAPQQAQTERRIPPALLWTGIGLLAAGGVSLARGAAADPEDLTCVSGANVGYTCISDRKVLLTTGAVLAGVGGALLAVGVAKSHGSPSITFRPGGVAVRQQVPLDLGVRRLFRLR